MSEVLKKATTETGGILLGYRDGSEWIVAESIDPGPNSIFRVAYFEYDQAYTTHLANRVRHYYDPPLEILGLWHRHPGSFDQFSSTDDGTNSSFAQMNPFGSISGLVNIDPEFRFTLYHVSAKPFGYDRIPYTVLGADESSRLAPLRNIEELASTIAWKQSAGASSDHKAPSQLNPANAYAKDMADWVNRAIEANEGVLNLKQASLVLVDIRPYLEDVQEVLEDDLKAFSEHGISLNEGLSSEYCLELSAGSGDNRWLICTLVMLRHSESGEDTLCLMKGSDGESVLPYTPGLLWRIVNWALDSEHGESKGKEPKVARKTVIPQSAGTADMMEETQSPKPPQTSEHNQYQTVNRFDKVVRKVINALLFTKNSEDNS